MSASDKSASPAADARQGAQREAESLLGDFRALLQQVGSPGPFWETPVDAPLALGNFLENYLTRLLLPWELPAIAAACGHARRGELRELLAQDDHLAPSLMATPFGEPSQRMGRLHLARLRPLRDDRIVQRYLAAVDAGQAHGWHTLVYGVTLAVYSLPLRQGLLFYSHEILSALSSAAARSKNFSAEEIDQILSASLARVRAVVETVLAGEPLAGV